MVANLIPPPPLTTTPAEANAVAKLLLANARGEARDFARNEPFAWGLVMRVWILAGGTGDTFDKNWSRCRAGEGVEMSGDN